jgi:hypothetical protein
MNRILEAYEGDSQFSRSRLIDEDESTQNDLKAIKVRKPFILRDSVARTFVVSHISLFFLVDVFVQKTRMHG